MFLIDLQSRIPIYEQLKNKIKELIALDLLKENEQLPSVRALARDLGVNPNTVQKTYQDLEKDGFIYSLLGKGSFVSQSNEKINRIQAEAINKFKVNVKNIKMLGVSRETVMETVDKVYGGEI